VDARLNLFGNELVAKLGKHINSAGRLKLAAVVSIIALINFYNRINVITRQPTRDYRAGQWN
jgi:hypothetical protein